MFAARDELAAAFGAAQGRRPRAHRVRRRRLRRQAGRGVRGARRRGARARHRPPGPARQRPPRRAARRRPPRRDAADRAARRAQGRHDHRDRRRRRRRDGAGRLGVPRPRSPPARSIAATTSARWRSRAKTNLRAQNAFRAPGVMEGTAAFEQAIDELALALDIDPLELRRRNHADVDQASGLPYSSKQLLACYDRAAELAGWDGPRRAARAAAPTGCCAGWAARPRSGGAAAARRRTRRSGSTPTATPASSPGSRTSARARSRRRRSSRPRSSGCRSTACASSAGTPRPNVYGPVAGGSQTTPSVMPAVRSAVGEGPQDAAPARRRRLRDRGRRPRGARRPDPLARRRHRRRRDGGDREARQRDDRRLGLARAESGRVRGAHVRLPDRPGRASIPALGEVRVERIVAVHDVGRIVNPLAASSQVEGGVLQGMAFALSEELVDRPDDRRPRQRPPRRLQGARRSRTCPRS